MTTLREISWSSKRSRHARLAQRHRLVPENGYQLSDAEYIAALRAARQRRQWWQPSPAAGVKRNRRPGWRR